MATPVPGGYAGRWLRVDLTVGRLADEVLDADALRKWVGGSGLGARILYDEVEPGTSWDDPANRLIIASGPLGGTRVMGSGTFSAVTKGPLTNGAVTTQANGFLGAFLKFCGYDGVILQGAANRLVYLYIHDGGAELRDATHLAGKDTWETKEILSTELRKGPTQLSVFGIGPAGEHLVKFAGIAGDQGHVAGHNGSGAVMGSKRLKAIAVARGSRRFDTASPQRLAELAEQLVERIKTDPASRNTYLWGTSMGFTGAEAGGWLPVRNYTTNVFPEHGAFMGDVVRNTFEIKPHPCWACQMHHCHIMKVTRGPATGYVGEEPEYEQWAAWGPVIGNTDPGLAVQLANEVDRLGFETNETGWLVGWVMECYEKGLLTREQLDGLEMRWGNVEAALALLRKIARREGVGDLLAEGVMRASQRIGGEAARCAVYTQKGNSPRGHDHRARWTELLDTCTSSTGTIETGPVFFPQEFGLPAQSDPFDWEAVAASVARGKGRMIFEDCLGTCRFCTRTEVSFLADLLSAATGWDFSKDEVIAVGRRTANLLRVFNVRHGITAEVDRPSARYGSIPVDGAAKGRDVGTVFDRMRARYYELLGWDPSTGKPLPETLRALGLEPEAAAIW